MKSTFLSSWIRKISNIFLLQVGTFWARHKRRSKKCTATVALRKIVVLLCADVHIHEIALHKPNLKSVVLHFHRKYQPIDTKNECFSKFF